MSIYIDPDKIEELAHELRKFSRDTEEMETRVYRMVSNLIAEVNTEYNESYVREVTREINRDLNEARQLAAEATGLLNEIAREAENAASEYRYNAQKQAQTIMQSTVTFILNMPLMKALKGVYRIVKTGLEYKISLTQPFDPEKDYAALIAKAIKEKDYKNLQKYVDERDAKIASDKGKYKDVKSTGEYLKSLGYVGVREYLRDQKGFDDKQITYKDGKVCINNDYSLDIEGIVLTGHTNYASVENIEKALERAKVPIPDTENKYTGSNPYSIGEKGIDDLIDKIYESLGCQDESIKEILYIQFYLRILENYADFHDGNSDRYDIGQTGLFQNGVDGSIGQKTLKALYNFQQSHPNVEKTIIKNDGKYSGSYGASTINALRQAVIEVDKAWQKELKETKSLLSRAYPMANPYFYTEFVKEEGDSDYFDEIDPILKSRLAALARDNQQYLRFGEGLRSYERQLYFWNEKNAGSIKGASYPGLSRHNWGMAVDTKTEWLKNLCGGDKWHFNQQKELRAYGLYKPQTSGIGTTPEEWHIEPVETWDPNKKNPNKDEIEPSGYCIDVKEMVENYYAYSFRPVPEIIIRKIKEKVETAKSKGVKIEPDLILIQACLKHIGFDLGTSCGDGIDGSYGPKTKEALASYIRCKSNLDISNMQNVDSIDDKDIYHNKELIIELIKSVEAGETVRSLGL